MFVLTLDDIIDIIVALICIGLFCYYTIRVLWDSKKEKRAAQRKVKDEGTKNENT